MPLLLVVLATTTGCYGSSTRPALAASAAAQCVGGILRRVCVAQELVCVTRFRDAGRPCTDKSECEGLCLVSTDTICDEPGNCREPRLPRPGDKVVGTCQEDDDPCGSFIEVRGGIAQPGYNAD